jgi:hypothetical protein
MAPLPTVVEAQEDVVDAQCSMDGRRILLMLSDGSMGRYVFVDLNRGAVTEFGEPTQERLKLSPDGRRAAHSTLPTTNGTKWGFSPWWRWEPESRPSSVPGSDSSGSSHNLFRIVALIPPPDFAPFHGHGDQDRAYEKETATASVLPGP